MEHATKKATVLSTHIFEMITGTHPQRKDNYLDKINLDQLRRTTELTPTSIRIYKDIIASV